LPERVIGIDAYLIIEGSPKASLNGKRFDDSIKVCLLVYAKIGQSQEEIKEEGHVIHPQWSNPLLEYRESHTHNVVERQILTFSRNTTVTFELINMTTSGKINHISAVDGL
jgi:hypothetical protein